MVIVGVLTERGKLKIKEDRLPDSVIASSNERFY